MGSAIFGKKWMAGLAALLLVVSAAIAFAQAPPDESGRMPHRGGRMGPGGRGGMGLPPIFMRLDLSDEQRTQIRSLMDGRRNARDAMRDDLRKARQQLGAAIYVASPDSGQVSELTGQLADLQRQALDADVAMQLEVSALLTDAQRRQILEWQAQESREMPPPPR